MPRFDHGCTVATAADGLDFAARYAREHGVVESTAPKTPRPVTRSSTRLDNCERCAEAQACRCAVIRGESAPCELATTGYERTYVGKERSWYLVGRLVTAQADR